MPLSAAAFVLSLLVAEGEGGIRGPTREVTDPTGFVHLTIPARWQDAPVSGTQLLRWTARDGGGHDVILHADSRQADEAAQRDRYLEYDNEKRPGGTAQKVQKPFFGYRLYLPKENLVILRAFVTAAESGFVLTVTSRHEGYDAMWLEQIAAIAATMRPTEGGAAGPARPAEVRRRFDKRRRVSLVAPVEWRASDQEAPEEWLCLSTAGATGLPRMAVVWWGGPSDANLVLTKVSAQWGRLYQNIDVQRVSESPPAMVVKGRKPGAVDYLIGLDDGLDAYTLSLCVREEDFERLRKVADEVAKTVVFSDARYRPPAPPQTPFAKPFRKLAVVHADEGLAAAGEALLASLDGFEKAWRDVGIGHARKEDPLRILVVKEDELAIRSNGFGERIACYDPAARLVVAAAPPAITELLPEWRAGVHRAMVVNLLKRDVVAPVPPWLVYGLQCLVESAARGEKGAEGPNPIHIGTLRNLNDANGLVAFARLLEATSLQYEKPEAADLLACTWGYVHLMRFGKGSAASLYRSYVKALESGKVSVPPLDVKNVKMEEELKAHVTKRLAAD